MARTSTAPRTSRLSVTDQSRSAFRLITAPHVPRHPDAVALDTAVELAAVLLEEGVEIVEQVSITLVAHTTTLAGRHDQRQRLRQ
jgi:hypothetical protein